MATFDMMDLRVAGANNVALAMQDQNDNTYRLETTTNRIKFTKNGSDTTLQSGLIIPSGSVLHFEAAAASYASLLTDVNDNELIDTQAVASAVNHIGISNAATTNNPIISAKGGDTNVGLTLDTQAAGMIRFSLGGTAALQLHDAAAMTFAAAADTAGHDAYLQTQDGGVDTAVDGGSAGGALEVRTGDGSAGGAAQAGGAGGALTLAGGAGGAPASGSANGGAGASINLTGGAGGAAGASGGTGGDGGSILLTPGAAGGAGGGTAGPAGSIYQRGVVVPKYTAATISTAGVAAYTAAQVLNGIIVRDPNGAGRADTVPTGAALEAAVGGTMAVGDTIVCYLINSADAAEAITVTTDTGVTIVNGSTHTVAQGEAAVLLFRRTAANTFDCYVIN